LKSPYYWHLLLSNISSFFVVIPFAIGCIRWKFLDAGEKFLLALMAISLVVEIVGMSLRDQHENNLYVYHIYTALECILLSIYYIKTFSQKKIILCLKITIGLFICVIVFDFLSNGYKEMDNVSTTTESILFMMYASAFFYFLLKDPIYPKIVAAPVFWINSAVLLYFSGNLFVFIFSRYLQAHSPRIVYCELWDIHSLLNILFYLLISFGFWKTKQ
jgi:hypothetical protein